MVIVKVNDIVNVEKNLKDIMFMDDNDHFYAMNFLMKVIVWVKFNGPIPLGMEK